ncbi:MAG: FAD-dependent oxidoreductase [Minicystis sp.]
MVSKKVTVVGGGITGLTVAHELVERGFEVTVVEKVGAAFDEDECQVGGMARTQWGLAEIEPPSYNQSRPPMRRVASLGDIGAALGRTIPFRRGSFELEGRAATALDEVIGELLRYKDAWQSSLEAGAERPSDPYRFVVIEGHATTGEALGVDLSLEALARTCKLTDRDRTNIAAVATPGDGPARLLSRYRAVAVMAYLRDSLPAPEKVPTKEMKFYFTPVGLGGFEDPLQGSANVPRVTFSLYEAQIPGEHGYRYFPAFYRHVFDTMRRTPLLETAPIPPDAAARALEVAAFWASQERIPLPLGEIESTRTVHDNLVPTAGFAIATGRNRALLSVSRARPRSLLEIRRLLRTSFDDLGISIADILLFEIKILQYLTSSRERRAQYAEMTWWDYLQADRYGERFKELIERWPQALIGIRAKLADARTIGTVSVQLLLDQLATAGFRDGTLNGPTSAAWLDPWKRYLVRRRVRFVRDTLTALEMINGKPSGRWARRKVFSGDDEYLVLAVPLPEAKRLVEELWASASAEEQKNFSASIRALHDWDVQAFAKDGSVPLDRLSPEGPLRLYSGVQLYLNRDFGPAQGHLYFAASEWRLSAISQAQYWRRRLLGDATTADAPPAFDDHISILSVDIGDWMAPVTDASSPVRGKCAAECSPLTLAKEVWRQVKEGLQQQGWEPPDPIAYHIDDDVVYGPLARPIATRAPYLVNRAGDWEKRPGDLSVNHYDVFQGVVLAGTYMKTHTRLVTMESANESGRRAANAVLADYAEKTGARVPQASPVWSPEDDEVDDLDWLKDLDRALVKRGLPHLLEILDVSSLVTEKGGATLSPDAIIEGVLAALGAPGATFAVREALPVQMIRRALSLLFDEDR